jgi:hypothetical protein
VPSFGAYNPDRHYQKDELASLRDTLAEINDQSGNAVLPRSTKTLVTSTLSTPESSCPARELLREMLLDLNKSAELKFLQKSVRFLTG